MFHFKKFSIDDSKAAMKIGTDAVLIGAWVPCGNETRILDIGTGSGILALMMAQRNTNTLIDAVEIDYDASMLAELNVQLSPWPNQVHIFNTTIQEFSLANKHNYSLVICNPPFFTDSLKAPDKARSTARHNDTLPVKDLLHCTSNLLTDNGKAAFIIPANAYENWKVEAAKQYLYPTLTTWVKSSESHNPHRVMIAFSREKQPAIIDNEISIYSSKNIYSPEYRELTRDFYLKF
jgi:tRNA1Val (adenine37-N6)-methyltransferase